MYTMIRALPVLVLLTTHPGGAQSRGEVPFDPLRDAETRIERLRKADATVVVLDRRGKPVSSARVRIEQVRHSFLFGCAALSLLKHADAGREQEYQKRFGDLFNFATLLTYWHDTDPEPGRRYFTLLDKQVDRLNAMGITVKGHPLILAGAFPKWAPADPDEVRRLTEQRILELVARYRGRIQVWDVVGDATTASGANNGLGAWARKAGPAQFTADALTWARQANPTATLLYNDYKLDGDFTKLVTDVLALGAPLDVLGLEAHMVGSEWPLEKVWSTAETFAALKKPLHFSEITVLSDDQKADHGKTWPTTTEGEQRQADYVEKMYTVLFSHPALQGIAWWNLVDGDWDRIPGGLLRSDLTPKPAYERLKSLIRDRWWTRAEISTNANGVATFRGFMGHYHVIVEQGPGSTSMDFDVVRAKPNRIVVRMK
jgi:GH35 family endo-1,4-beta-xylanase